MEGVVLDDTAVCLCQCGGQELFAGGTGKAPVFFFDHGAGEFYPVEAIVQCPADAVDERSEPGSVCADAW